MVTVAPGSTPPVSSLTVPEIEPVSTCALTGADSNTVNANADTPLLPSGWMRKLTSRLTEFCAEPSLTVFVLQAYPPRQETPLKSFFDGVLLLTALSALQTIAPPARAASVGGTQTAGAVLADFRDLAAAAGLRTRT